MVTEPSQCQQEGTKENPTDLCTKGETPDKFNGTHSGGMDERGFCRPRMDIRNGRASLEEMKTFVLGGGRKRAMEPKCEYRRLQPTWFSSWTLCGFASGQGVESNLQYAQLKGQGKKARILARRRALGYSGLSQRARK